MKNNSIITDRLHFGIWTNDDLDQAVSLWGDRKVTKLISADGRFSFEKIKERLESEIENNRLYSVQYWPVYTLDTNDFIGCCGLRPYDLSRNIYELGFHFRSDYWGKGYATEAARAVINYALNELKVESLFAGHHPVNESSKRLLLKLGFEYTHDEFYEGTGLMHPSYILLRQS